jgi:hypothetical protein
MNTKKLIFTALVLGVTELGVSRSASAEVLPDLYRYFSQKISELEAAAPDAGPEPAGSAGMILQDINLDLTPSVTFGLSSVLNLSISPEIDFVLAPDATS